MFPGREVAEHGRAVPAGHRRTHVARDVAVARRDVGGERVGRMEWRLVTHLALEAHVLLDLVHGDVARTSHHDLHVVPRRPGQLTHRAQSGELRLVVGVCDAARPQPKAHVRGCPCLPRVNHRLVGVQQVFHGLTECVAWKLSRELDVLGDLEPSQTFPNPVSKLLHIDNRPGTTNNDGGN